MTEKVVLIDAVRQRRAGQALEERLVKLQLREVWLIAGLLFALGLMLGAMFVPKSVSVAGGLGIVILVVFLPAILSTQRTIGWQRARIELGLAGEKAVGAVLDELRGDGGLIVNDFQCGTFNIDHIVIHETGVFAIETKTKFSHRAEGENTLFVSGRKAWANRKLLKPNPASQAMRQAKWLHDYIKKNHGIDIFVIGVVAFPGWYIRIQRRHPFVIFAGVFELSRILRGKRRGVLSLDQCANLHAGLIRAQSLENKPDTN